MRGSAHAPRRPEPAPRVESTCRRVLSVSRVSAFPGPRRPHRTYSRLRRPAGAFCSLPRRGSSPSLGTREQTELPAPERPHLQRPRGLGPRRGLCACAARPPFRKRKSPGPTSGLVSRRGQGADPGAGRGSRRALPSRLRPGPPSPAPRSLCGPSRVFPAGWRPLAAAVDGGAGMGPRARGT